MKIKTSHILSGMFVFPLISLAQAQLLNFNVGDAVEIKMASTWRACTIAAPLVGNGYDVHCGPLDLRVKADADHLRARAVSADEQGVQDETKTAMENRPLGDGVGAQFGTREPVTCMSRNGPLTDATARQYFICDAEGESAGIMYLVTDVTIHLSRPRAFNFNLDSSKNGIDTSQQVYDVRGSYNKYLCNKPTAIDNDFSRTHNCSLYDEPHAEGSCYKDTFDEWHCLMTDFHRAAPPKATNVMPPSGN